MQVRLPRGYEKQGWEALGGREQFASGEFGYRRSVILRKLAEGAECHEQRYGRTVLLPSLRFDAMAHLVQDLLQSCLVVLRATGDLYNRFSVNASRLGYQAGQWDASVLL